MLAWSAATHLKQLGDDPIDPVGRRELWPTRCTGRAAAAHAVPALRERREVEFDERYVMSRGGSDERMWCERVVWWSVMTYSDVRREGEKVEVRRFEWRR